MGFIKEYALYFKLALLAVLLAAIGVQTVRLAGAQADVAKGQAKYSQLETVLANERKAASDQHAKDVAHVLDVEHQMQADGQEQRKNDEKALDALAADRDRLAGLLRNRPHRPTAGTGNGVSQPAAAAGSGGGCGAGSAAGTGAGLYEEDGVFLAGEAASAVKYGIALRSCLQQYEDAREKLKSK